ncbi:hypothetical protein SELMODRAFT_421198 [Selaginella moellendorffii]|uniref:Peptidase A1 domain-containing protein n=1 Tax=Selaginella moellendorffii TaxID=88036 RepID=D8SEB8_SELML|nr:hypothetical protein SELMODRAFT_421198 [Selaginella moellendorffii]
MAAITSTLILVLVSAISCTAQSQPRLSLPFETRQVNNGRKTRYVSRVTLNDAGSTSSGTSYTKAFTIDTSSNQVSVSSCSNNRASFELLVATSSFFTTKASFPVDIDIVCSSSQGNVIGLAASGSSSLPLQVSRSAKLAHRFTYCLASSSGRGLGELYIGQQGPYRVFHNTDILNSTSLPMLYFPLTVSSSGSYHLKLDSVSLGSKTTVTITMVEIGTSFRYTRLPQAAYQMLRDGFLREVGEKKLGRDSSSFGELDLCYKMSVEQRTTFSNVTMVVSGIPWMVSGDNYLVTKPGIRNVACFAFVSAGKDGRSVIGTAQQENNFVEFDVDAKKLGVSGSLFAAFGLAYILSEGKFCLLSSGTSDLDAMTNSSST